jgi:hypothetical protein
MLSTCSRGALGVLWAHACSVHTLQKPSTLVLILKHLWGRLVGVPSGSGRLVIGPSLLSGRPVRPRFPAQGTLPKGSSFAGVNASSLLSRSALWGRLANLRPVDKLAPAPSRHISSGCDDAAIVGQPILAVAAFQRHDASVPCHFKIRPCWSRNGSALVMHHVAR